jgi:cation diffusion facilitator CzcD-associated flavoprotein CzcO
VTESAGASGPEDPREVEVKDAVEVDVVVVGAGFGGLYALHRLRQLGLSIQVFEAGSGIGGTWFWNRYPGARCDVESMAYSYSFSPELEQEWRWTERYATQPEILEYAEHVADRFDLRDRIQLNTRVTSAVFQEAKGRWLVRTDAGDVLSARFCIMATGCLSCRNTPLFEGIGSFRGQHFHTGDWPEEGVDLAGKRVGIIGTGSTSIQAIPHLAQDAAQLFVFQRAPNYSVPARNHAMTEEYQDQIKADYASFRAPFLSGRFGLDFDPSDLVAANCTDEEIQSEFERRWAAGGLAVIGSFADIAVNKDANDRLAEFIRDKIRGAVDDPKVAELLCPDSVVACKRPCADTNYFETYNRTNVELVDISNSAIEKITESGLIVNGREYELDVIVFATGFDAMTGALLSVDIRGRNDQRLGDRWSEGPKTFLGLAIDGFPNFFTITGPGSPSVLANMIPAIEQHVDWIADCLEYMAAHDKTQIEPEREAVENWVMHVSEVADQTLFPTCNSWYLGANIPGKPRVFMPYLGFPPYKQKCDEVAASGYDGFQLTAAD